MQRGRARPGTGINRSCAGVLTVYAGTSLDSVDQVVRLTIEEFRRMKGDKLPAEELRRAKDHLKGSLMLSLENTTADDRALSGTIARAVAK